MLARPGSVIAIALVALSLPSGCTRSVAMPGEGPPVALDRVPVVYGFGRRFRDEIDITGEDWDAIRAMFATPAPDAAAERVTIAHAVAAFEKAAGERTPTHVDVGQNGGRGMGQMDCVDECTNTSTYLRILEEHGLLVHHRMIAPVYRGPLGLGAHNTAAVEDLATGERYVIDSWFGSNGELPRVQRLDRWYRRERYESMD